MEINTTSCNVMLAAAVEAYTISCNFKLAVGKLESLESAEPFDGDFAYSTLVEVGEALLSVKPLQSTYRSIYSDDSYRGAIERAGLTELFEWAGVAITALIMFSESTYEQDFGDNLDVSNQPDLMENIRRLIRCMKSADASFQGVINAYGVITEGYIQMIS